MSLRWLIDSRFAQFQKGAERSGEPLAFTLNDTIRRVINGIETTLRFEYARDLKAYLDILALALRTRAPVGEPRILPPLPLYLECGSSNPGVIRLMSLGLTRLTALLIRKLIVGMRDDATPEDWFAALARQSLATLPLPKICIQEIAHLTAGR